GRNVIAFEGFELQEAGDGIVTYEMRVNPVEDGFLQNNVGYGLTRVEGDARVLVIARDPEAGEDFGRLLQAQGIAVDVRTSGALVLDAPALIEYRAIVLVDVAATSFSRAQLEALAHFVEETGGGLLAIGEIG